MWWSSSFLASRGAFGPTCFPRANSNMVLFKLFALNRRVALSRCVRVWITVSICIPDRAFRFQTCSCFLCVCASGFLLGFKRETECSESSGFLLFYTFLHHGMHWCMLRCMIVLKRCVISENDWICFWLFKWLWSLEKQLNNGVFILQHDSR